LAVGAAYLAKEKAIVQKLTAIESLAVSSRSSPPHFRIINFALVPLLVARRPAK
jgi:hypothetical protein